MNLSKLCGGAKIFSDDPRMTRRDSKESDRGAVGSAPSLFPVSQRMHADPHRQGEPRLGQSHESSERGDVSGGEFPV